MTKWILPALLLLAGCAAPAAPAPAPAAAPVAPTVAPTPSKAPTVRTAPETQGTWTPKPKAKPKVDFFQCTQTISSQSGDPIIVIEYEVSDPDKQGWTMKFSYSTELGRYTTAYTGRGNKSDTVSEYGDSYEPVNPNCKYEIAGGINPIDHKGPVAPTVKAKSVAPAESYSGTWIAVLESVPYSEGFQAAQIKAQKLGPTTWLLDSSDYPSLNPGYHVVHLGRFVSKEEASRACATVGRPVGEKCYPRSLDTPDG